jgi:hypothetical protein
MRRHGAMTDPEAFELADGQGCTLSAPRSKLYVGLRSFPRASAPSRKRHAHVIASACEEQTALNFGMVRGEAFAGTRLENKTALPKMLNMFMYANL